MKVEDDHNYDRQDLKSKFSNLEMTIEQIAQGTYKPKDMRGSSNNFNGDQSERYASE